MTDAGRLDLNQNFTSLRAGEIDLRDLERLSSGDGDGGLRLHSLGLPEQKSVPNARARLTLTGAERRSLSGATLADVR